MESIRGNVESVTILPSGSAHITGVNGETSKVFIYIPELWRGIN